LKSLREKIPAVHKNIIKTSTLTKKTLKLKQEKENTMHHGHHHLQKNEKKAYQISFSFLPQ
jgi:predicted metalloprotease